MFSQRLEWHAAHRLLPQVLGPDRDRLSAGHGAEPLTSIALNLFPHLVCTDMIPSPSAAPEVIGLPVSGFASVSFEGIDIAIPVESRAVRGNLGIREDHLVW
jgi:creatinine amidohydrolase